MRRARTQADALGKEVRQARIGLGWSRSRVARRAGVSPDTERRIEDGDPAIQLDTSCAVAEAVGIDVVLRMYPGRQPSLRDSGQLAVAEYLCADAAPFWQPQIELRAGDHGQAVDVAFFGPTEILAAEIDRLVHDFQEQHRRNDLKRQWLAARHERPVRLVMVVEDTPRNRRAVEEHASLIARVLPAGSREILKAIRTGTPLGRDGLLWVRSRRLHAGSIDVAAVLAS